MGATYLRCLVLTFLLGLGTAAGHAQENDKEWTAEEEKAVAITAVKQMSQFLKELDRFSVVAQISEDEVLLDGQKIQLDSQVEVVADPPNKLWAEVDSPRSKRQLFYDGKQFTLYALGLNFYASLDTPSTIRETLAVAEEYDIHWPLADLFLWADDQDVVNSVKNAIYVGPERVNGVVCNHYAFRQEDVDWQICIRRGDAPLPLKLVITTTSETEQPQYVAILQWDTSPDVTKHEFTFKPRENDHPIVFDKNTDAN